MKMARIDLKPGALTAPLPPVLVTVKSEGVPNIITIGWTGILATNPPKTYISIRPQRHSYEMLKQSREFVINLAPAALAPAVDYCGIYTGAKVNKFEKCALTERESKVVSVPTIAECPIALECRVTDILPMGTHDVFMADIVSALARGCIKSQFYRVGIISRFFDRVYYKLYRLLVGIKIGSKASLVPDTRREIFRFQYRFQ